MSKKVPTFKAGDVWFTSDTHYFHKLAVQFRGMGSVEEMNQLLISNWNSVIKPNDMVFHLGDVSFGSNAETENVLDKLLGLITLVRGNHDRGLSAKAKARFVNIVDMHEIDVEEGGQKTRMVLCHYAMRVWNKHHYGSWQLHGHSHGNLPPIGRQMDVGVDTNEFKPYSFEQIKQKLAIVPIHVVDHHRGD